MITTRRSEALDAITAEMLNDPEYIAISKKSISSIEQREKAVKEWEQSLSGLTIREAKLIYPGSHNPKKNPEVRRRAIRKLQEGEL